MDKQTVERIKKGLKDSGTGPETIALMVTGSCNLNCVFAAGAGLKRNPRTREN
jgi:pyruvate formate-lyase activating enzyme-like uncharacterized protein